MWKTFLDQVRQDRDYPPLLLALDPGETTGWAVFHQGSQIASGQITSTPLALHELIHSICPTHVVCEDYRIYQSKTKLHTHSTVPVARLIGAIELSVGMLHIPLDFQSAGDVKRFCTNAKLKEWELYRTGNQHANDAIRHGCYFLLFRKV